jgi:hypothetical protein
MSVTPISVTPKSDTPVSETLGSIIPVSTSYLEECQNTNIIIKKALLSILESVIKPLICYFVGELEKEHELCDLIKKSNIKSPYVFISCKRKSDWFGFGKRTEKYRIECLNKNLSKSLKELLRMLTISSKHETFSYTFQVTEEDSPLHSFKFCINGGKLALGLGMFVYV